MIKVKKIKTPRNITFKILLLSNPEMISGMISSFETTLKMIMSESESKKNHLTGEFSI